MKNGSSREPRISLTPICFHIRSLPSRRVGLGSIVLRPDLSSVFEMSSVAKTQVSQLQPSCHQLCPKGSALLMRVLVDRQLRCTDRYEEAV